MPTLTARIEAATLITPARRCPKCTCGSFLTTAQERKDGLCIFCADAPAVVDIHPSAVIVWAMAKGRRMTEEGGQANV